MYEGVYGHPLTNKHNHLDLKRNHSSHASFINLMNRNGSKYNTSDDDESYSTNSTHEKGLPNSIFCLKRNNGCTATSIIPDRVHCDR